ncbi:MAG: metallophosphatase family protein [Candidatus Omnitrophica bacterium]|nr:metallophosphatase family protein [Candidatus Omnitrophota bacterium]
MRYAIFSDVHSNLEAFQTLLGWLKNQNIDSYILLGDIIGYGANPNEVIGLLKELNSVCLAGNHDWAMIGKFDIDCFNSNAKNALLWTRSILREEEINYLFTFPLIYQEKNFTCVHGSLWEPEEFNYVIDPQEAILNFKIMEKQICFIGHSHRKELYVWSDKKLYYSTDEEITLEENSKYIVNVGSVGQPRDRDNRLCVCIYDDEEKKISFTRLSYDIRRAANKIIKAGLPPILAERLYSGY